MLLSQDKDYDSDGAHDNYCSACGGSGQLVLCDGCARAFHFCCNDPPFTEAERNDEETPFVCRVCSMRNVPRGMDDEPGPFGPLLANLARTNPKSFSLPEELRDDTFENTKTGEEGDYQTILPAQPPKQK